MTRDGTPGREEEKKPPAKRDLLSFAGGVLNFSAAVLKILWELFKPRA